MEFAQLSEALSDYPGIDSASFLQGMLTGLMVGDSGVKESAWMKLVLEEAGIKKVKERFLIELHQMYLATEAGLNGSGFELDFCLPDEQESLIFRAMMLGQWVEGFLYGLGLTGYNQQKLTKDSSELLRDFADISGIEMSGLEALEGEALEEAEADMMQLMEYVKIGVLTLNEDINPVEGQPIMEAEPPTPTLH